MHKCVLCGESANSSPAADRASARLQIPGGTAAPGVLSDTAERSEQTVKPSPRRVPRKEKHFALPIPRLRAQRSRSQAEAKKKQIRCIKRPQGLFIASGLSLNCAREKKYFFNFRFPQPRPQRSGSRLEAKKFPVRLRNLATRRGFVPNREFLSWSG